ncbi:NAD(P)-binding protein [Sutterella sp.]|uniref:NAD(P)-binding protein n=1 Tax=Sutterella sp. TaxID=1981025 RepID=UPI003FD72F5C
MLGFSRRIEATPPGQCALALQLSLLEASALQTCGKCVPCRDGLPQLARLLRRIVECEAVPEDLERLKALAEMIRSGSDCAIGYDAAQAVLDGMTRFADEYKHHVEEHACQKGVAQSVPCETFCPAHVDVPGYIALVAEGRSADAVALIRKDNPFPTACGYVCEHPCEKRCRRTLIDAPINIRAIKKYACDQAAADTVPTPKRLPDTGCTVAVIGGGPAGLTCAYFLALMGHKVELYEEKKHLGGMMRYGIPAYRFPRERLDEDVNAILGVGNITVHLESPVGTEEMKRLASECDAVFVSIGAHAAKKLRLPGMEAKGVISAVEMLRDIGDGVYPDYRGKKIAVIGGGNVAMDCVRTAVRAGAEEVNLVYRRRIEDMTALKEEIESAIAEGVEMLTLKAPLSVEMDESGACRALLMQPQMISAYSRGRPGVVAAQKPVERLEADLVVAAIGQDVVTKPFEDFGMKTHWGAFVTDEFLLAEGFTNVYVGGDCQSGPTTVIKAVGAGKVAARNIDEMLGFHHSLDCGVSAPEPRMNDRTPKGRVNLVERPVKFRKRDFNEVEIGMSHEEVQQECGRCLRCDHFGAGAACGGRIQYV